MRFLRIIYDDKAIPPFTGYNRRDSNAPDIQNRQRFIKPVPNSRLVILRIEINGIHIANRLDPGIDKFKRETLKPCLIGPYTLSAPFIRHAEISPVLITFQNIGPIGIIKRGKRRKQLFDCILRPLFGIKHIDAVSDRRILLLLLRDVVRHHHRLVFVQNLVLRDIADKAAVMPAYVRRIKAACIFRNRIALLELFNKRLCRKMLDKRLTVFLIDKLVCNFFYNRIIRRKIFTKRAAHIPRLAFDNLDKGARNFPFRKIHLKIAIGLIKNRLSIKLLIESALEPFTPGIQIHRLDFVAQFFFGGLLD